MKQYLTVNGKLVTIDGKLIEISQVDAGDNGVSGDTVDAQVLALDEEVTTIDELDLTTDYIQLVQAFNNGSPKESFDTLSDLNAKYPNGTNAIMLTKDDGHWHYYYNGAWQDGGVYLSDVNTPPPIGRYVIGDETSPASIYPNTTWERIKDVFLLASGDIYANDSTGGEATHTLTTNEMPSHKHEIYMVSQGSGEWKGFAGGISGNYNQWNHQYIEETGGNQPHNNMPPYLAVPVWKRIA